MLVETVGVPMASAWITFLVVPAPCRSGTSETRALEIGHDRGNPAEHADEGQAHAAFAHSLVHCVAGDVNRVVRQQLGVELPQHLSAEKLDRFDAGQVLEVADEKHTPAFRERQRRRSQLLAVGNDVDPRPVADEVADNIGLSPRCREDGVRRCVNLQLPDHLGSVVRVEAVEIFCLGGITKDVAGLPDEVQVARVNDDTGGRRASADRLDYRLGELPQAQDRHVEAFRAGQRLEVLFNPDVYGDALPFEDRRVLLDARGAVGDARHGPVCFPQEFREMQKPPREAVQLRLRHVVRAN